MADALRYHVMEGEDLQKLNNQLSITNKQLMEEKDLNSIIVKEKIMQSKKQNDQIKELQNKVMSMEYTLSHIVREFDQEKEIISKLAKQEIDKVRYTVDTLKSELDIRIKQMKQIRRIAQHILDQRTDLETFFMDALEHVRLEISREQEEKRRREVEEYNRRIKNVLKPKGDGDDSIKNLEKEVEEEQQRAKKNASKIDITQLSWSDKERVLRVLFAKMNGIVIQGSDGNEKNKITPDNSYDVPKNEDDEEEENSSGSDYTDSEDEEVEELHDSDLESISGGKSIDMLKEMKKQEEQDINDQFIIEKMKLEQAMKNKELQETGKMEENILKEISSPQSPSDEVQDKKKSSNSNLSRKTSTMNKSDMDNNDSNNNKVTSTYLEETDDGHVMNSTKEIMKSDESLDKFIHESMENCHKSEEELRAQSKESFDDFLKRSFSKAKDEEEAHDITEDNITNITETE